MKENALARYLNCLLKLLTLIHLKLSHPTIEAFSLSPTLKHVATGRFVRASIEWKRNMSKYRGHTFASMALDRLRLKKSSFASQSDMSKILPENVHFGLPSYSSLSVLQPTLFALCSASLTHWFQIAVLGTESPSIHHSVDFVTSIAFHNAWVKVEFNGPPRIPCSRIS